MRVVFCGSGTFAIPSLRAVASGPHELVAVVTQPARPAGRGGKLRPTPVAELVAELGCELADWPTINAPEAVEQLRNWRPDVICVVDFGQMLSHTVIESPSIDTFNLHASLLPKLRGAAPINWSIIEGFERTGVTTFSIVDKMDAGAIYAQSETPIDPTETAGDLRARLARLGAELVGQTLEMLADGQAVPYEQDESEVTFAPRLNKSDGRLDFSAVAIDLRNRIHGAWPWPGGQAVFEGTGRKPINVTIARAVVEAGDATGEPGTLDDELVVATGAGRLRIEQIKPAGKRLMDWRDFANGYRLAEGDHFRSVKS